LTAEPVKTPRVLLVTPVALSLHRSPSMTRQTSTLPYQPDDRGVLTSPSAEVPLPDYPTAESLLPHSPDVLLSLNFCREKLKQKIGLCGNDHESLRSDHNFAMCMHALATFHRIFDPIEFVDDKGYS
jgi:hypothetical protein